MKTYCATRFRNRVRSRSDVVRRVSDQSTTASNAMSRARRERLPGGGRQRSDDDFRKNCGAESAVEQIELKTPPPIAIRLTAVLMQPVPPMNSTLMAGLTLLRPPNCAPPIHTIRRAPELCAHRQATAALQSTGGKHRAGLRRRVRERARYHRDDAEPLRAYLAVKPWRAMRTAYGVGVDVGGTHIAAGLVDRMGRVVTEVGTLTPKGGPFEVVDAVVDLVSETAAGVHRRRSPASASACRTDRLPHRVDRVLREPASRRCRREIARHVPDAP